MVRRVACLPGQREARLVPVAGRNPPNNWIAVFGGPAWQWDEATGQSYYHAYLPDSPT